MLIFQNQEKTILKGIPKLKELVPDQTKCLTKQCELISRRLHHLYVTEQFHFPEYFIHRQIEHHPNFDY